MDYTQLILEVRNIADSGKADYLNKDYPNSDKLQEAANAIEALQARVTTLQYEVDAITAIKAERDAALAGLKELEASTARTYMDGYSDGKAWALEQALKVCAAEIARNDANETWICEGKRIALVIHKLKEGL